MKLKPPDSGPVPIDAPPKVLEINAPPKVFEIDDPPKALEIFIHAMYGVSLTDNLWPLKGDLRNVRDIVLFGHKYEIAHIESAVCEVITSHLDVEAMELRSPGCHRLL